MDTTSLRADPSAGFPLPDPGVPAPPLTALRRVTGAVESILYWGILTLGVLLPFVGALYGLTRT